MKRRRILTSVICVLLLFAFLPFSAWYEAANDIANAENTSAADATIGSGTGTGTDSSDTETVSKTAPYTPATGYQQYLSDFTSSQMLTCSVGWGTYTRDKNLDGKTIKLQINGKDQEFSKGVTAHASATLVYDLGENHDKFDYFQAWIGIDAYRENNGNVKFQFFVSDDNENWTELTEKDNLNNGVEFRNAFANGNTNAIQVKFDEVKTNRYLKIVIDKNGADTADHATLADAVLASNGTYTPPVVDFLKDASYYSAKLAGKSYAEIMNDESLEMALLQYRFMTLYGKDNLQTFLTGSMNYEKRINAFWWLFNDYEALKEFLNGGEPIGDNYLGALDVLADLYAEYVNNPDPNVANDLNSKLYLKQPDSEHAGQTRGDLYRRMMICMSLCCANGWNAWLARAGTCNPVNRYAYFKENYVNNKMRDEIFENLSVDEMRWVIGNNISDAEIVWLNDYARAHPRNGNQTSYPIIYSPHHHISYRWYNYDKDQYYSADNESTYRTKYMLDEKYEEYGLTYGYNADGSKTAQRLWMVFADGAVCGNISRTGANLAASFGVPACEVGQPGHAAFCIMNKKSGSEEMIWGIDNNISGWAQSSNSRRMPCDWGDDTQSWATGWKAQYCIIAQAALNDPENYAKAEEIMMAADLATTTAEKEACYQAALSYMPYHLDAWVALINLYNDTNSGKTAEDIVTLADQLCAKESKVCFYPKALEDLKNLLLKGLNTRLSAATDEATKTDLQEKISYINNIAFQTALQTALKATDKDCAQPDYAISTAKTMLNTADYTLATFSFDGENANKLVFNSNFSSVRYRYSLDGGANWTKSNTEYKGEGETNVKVALTVEEIKSITADNDIYIWLDGWAGDPNTEKAFKIDISAGQDVSGVEFNDKENRFIGTVTSMEYNLDNEKEEGSEKLKWRTLTNEVIAGLTDTENHTITVHKKASGTTLQGNDKTYTATNNDLDTRTYIPISQITLTGYSSEQTNQGDYAKYAIDGLAATRWHTAWNGSDKQRYIILKTSEAKYFSGIDYLPPPSGKGANGIITAGNVYVSMDGTNWMLAGTFKWADNFTEKQITFSQSVYGQYVKLEATGCHGGYAGASKIELFEDKTLVNKEVQNLSLLTMPTKKDYVQGESLDLTGTSVQLIYSDNTSALLPVELLTADKTIFDTNGIQLVTLSYGKYSVSFHVNVAARSGSFNPTGISIVRQPDKLTYYVGDLLDTTGLQVTATDGVTTVYLDANEYEVTADLSKESTDCKAKVTLKSNTDLTQEFDLTVKRAVKSIAVTQMPNKTTYELGDALDTTGLIVTAYYGKDEGETGENPDAVVLTQDDYLIENAGTFSEEPGDVNLLVQLADKTSIQTSFKVTVNAYFTQDDITYTFDPKTHTCKVTEIKSTETFVSIPSSVQIGGTVYTVTGIGSNVMVNAQTVVDLALPGTITDIEKEAFIDDANLKKIFFTAHTKTGFENLNVGEKAYNTEIELVFYAANDSLKTDLENKLRVQGYTENLNVSNVSGLITGIEVTPPTVTTVANGQKPSYDGLNVQALLTFEEEIEGITTTVERKVPIDLGTCTILPAADNDDWTKKAASDYPVRVTLTGTAHDQTFNITVLESKLHITENPVGAVYTTLNAKVTPLTVTAVSDSPEDQLDYQWYRSETGSLNEQNDYLEGAAQQTYTPNESGYYYVRVTKHGTDISVYSSMAEVKIGDFVAIVDDSEGYDSLKAAIDAANAKQVGSEGSVTVTLLKSVDLTEGITISNNITINGNGKTVTRSKSYTGTMLTVTSGTVTLNEVILDGGIGWYYNGTTDAEGYSAKLKRGWKDGGVKAQGLILLAKGTSNVSINGSVLQNNYNLSTTTGGAINIQGDGKGDNSAIGATVTLQNTEIANNYSEYFGSAVYQRDKSTLIINEGCSFHGNSGGERTTVICVDNKSTCTVNGGTFSYNAGKDQGGIFWVSKGSLTFNGGTFENNWTVDSSGTEKRIGRLLYLNGSAAVTINKLDKITEDEEIYLTSGKTITVGQDLADDIKLVIQTANKAAATKVVKLGTGVNQTAAQNAVTINSAAAGLKDSYLIIPCTSSSHTTAEKILKEATCQQAKITCTYCTTCGVIISMTTGEKGDHNYQHVDEVSATCTEDGHTAGEQCTVCGDVKSGLETIKATGHHHTITCTEGATCTQPGKVTYTCSCGDSYTVDSEPIGHDMSVSVTTEPTLDSPGVETHQCTRCDYQYTVELPKIQANTLQIKAPSKTTFVKTQSHTAATEASAIADGTVSVFVKNSDTDKCYEEVSLTAAGVAVTGPTADEWAAGGKQTVTVKYRDLTATYNIYIVDQAVETIEDFTAPTNTQYVAGKSTALDLSGGSWSGKYNDGTSLSAEDQTLKLSQISGTYDLNKAGTYELTATFQEGSVAVSRNFTIEVLTPEATKIEWITKPSSPKATYTAESGVVHSLDTSNLSLEVTLNGGLASETITSLDPETTTGTGLTAENFWGFEDNPTNFTAENGTVTQTITLKSLPDGTAIKSEIEMPSFTIEWKITATDKLEITDLQPASVVQGQDFAPTAGTVGVIYSNGQVFDKANITADMISEETKQIVKNTVLGTDDFSKCVTGTLTYQGKTGEFKIDVLKKELTKATFVKPTAKTDLEYVQNYTGQLTATSGHWAVEYNDGTTGTIAIDLPINLPVDYYFSTIGTHTISIPSPMINQETGKSDSIGTYDITVVAKQVQSMEWVTKPTKTTYVSGKATSLDVSGGEVKVTFNNGQTAIENTVIENVDLDPTWCTGFDASTSAGSSKKITVNKYGDYTFVSSEAMPSWTINFVREVESIAVTTTPNKMTYLVGEAFDPTGGKVTVTYSDGSYEVLPLSSNALTLSPAREGGSLSNLTTDDTTVKVTYQGKETTQAITVSSKKIVSAELVAPTTKSYYQNSGSSIDLSGGYWKVTYENGEVDTTTYTLNNTDTSSTGFSLSSITNALPVTLSQTLTDEHQNVFQATGTFIVQVSEDIQSVQNFIAPATTTYLAGQSKELNLTGGQWQVERHNGTKEWISLTKSQLWYSKDGGSTYSKSLDFSQAGTYTVKAQLKTAEDETEQAKWTRTFTITIEEPVVTAVSIEGTDQVKTDYIAGQDDVLDVSGLSLKLTYNGGTSLETVQEYVTGLTAAHFEGFTASVSNFSTKDEVKPQTIRLKSLPNGALIKEGITMPSFNIQWQVQATDQLKIEGLQPTGVVEESIYEPTAGTIRVVYSNGQTFDAVSIADSPYVKTQVDTSVAKDGVTGTLTYVEGGHKWNASFTVNVAAKTIVSAVLKAPTKTKYYQVSDEQLDLSDGYWVVTYDNGKTEKVSLDGAVTSGFDLTEAAENLEISVSQTLEGDYPATGTFNIQVEVKKIKTVNSLIEPAAGENNAYYIAGKSTAVDLSGYQWEVTYNNGKTENIAVTAANLSELPDFSKAGTQTVRVKLSGTDAALEVPFQIEVHKAKITDVSLKGTDSVQRCYQSDINTSHALDVAELSLNITYNDGKLVEENVTGLTAANFSGFTDNPQTFVQDENGTIPDVVQTITLTSVPDGTEIASDVTMPSYTISWSVTATDKIEIEGLTPSYVVVGNAFVPTAGTVGVIYSNGQVFDKTAITDTGKVSTDVSTAAVGEATGSLSYTSGETTRTAHFTIDVIAKAIEAATFNAPSKTAYIQDQTAALDLTGGYWDVTYNDKSTAHLPLELSAASGYDFTKTGTQTVSFNSPLTDGSPGTYEIEVASKKIQSMEWVTEPSVTEYVRGRDKTLNVTDGRVKITFNNEQEAIEADLDAFWCTGFDSEAAVGEHKIVVFKYEDYAFEDNAQKPYWTIRFVRKVKSIAVSASPKTNYIENQTFDPTGGKVTIAYYDTTEVIDLSSSKLTLSPSTSTALKVSDTTVKITYKDQDDVVHSTTETISVSPKQIAGAELIAPTKRSYVQDSSDTLSPDGGYWKVTYNNGEKETDSTKYPLTAESCSGFDLSNAADSLQISVSQKLDGYFAATGVFDVKVQAKAIETVDSFTAPSNSTYYIAGKSKTLDLTGGKWKVTYNNGRTEEIALTTADITNLADLDFSSAGTYTLDVELKDYKDSFKVVVHEPEVTAVTLNGVDSVNKSYVSESGSSHTLDVTGLSLNVVYNNVLTEENVQGLTAANFSGFSDNPRTFVQDENGTIPAITQTIELTSVPGCTKIAADVTMPSYTIAWSVTATDKIEIEGLAPSYVIVGNTFVPTAGTVGVIYSNGQVFDKTTVTDTGKVSVSVSTKAVGEGEGSLSLVLGDKERKGTFRIDVIAQIVTAATFKAPSKKDYIQDQTAALDLTDGHWDVTYNDNSTAHLPLELSAASGYDFTKTGTQTVSFNSPLTDGSPGTYEIEVAAKKIQKMEWVKQPLVSEYVRGKDTILDTTGGMVKVTFNNGQEAIESDLDASWCAGFNGSAKGSQTITVDQYGSYAFESGAAKPTWTIQMVDKVQSIAMAVSPNKTSYIEGEKFDPTGGKVVVVFYDGTEKLIGLSSSAKLTLSPNTNTKLQLGDTAVAITYKDTDGTEIVTSQSIDVRQKKIVSAELVKPTKDVYYQDSDEELDVSGGYWKVTYDNGETESDASKYPLDAGSCTGFDLSKAEDHLQISVNQNLDDVYHAVGSFEVKVIAKAVTKSSLTIPAATAYTTDDTALDLSGGKFTVEFNNGKSETFDLTEASYIVCDSPDFHSVGEQEIKVTYNKDGLTAVQSFKINVKLAVHEYKIGDNNVEAEHEEQKETNIVSDEASEEILENTVYEMVKKFDNNQIKSALNQLSKQASETEVTLKQCKVKIEVITKISVDKSKTQKNENNEITAMTLDIHPEAHIRLVHDDTNEFTYIGSEAVDITSTENQTLSMSVALPETFKTITKGYVRHKGYEYEGTIVTSGDSRTLNFKNPHGFSEFTVYAESQAAAVVGGNRYLNVQDAIDELQTGQSGQILELLQDVTVDLSSKPVGFSFTLKTNGHTLNYTVANDCELSAVKAADGTYTLTIAAKGTNPNGSASTDDLSPNTGITSGNNFAAIGGLILLAVVILIVWLIGRKQHKD